MYLKRVQNQMVIDAIGVKKEPIRYLLIPLFSAERAWSYAMALKQESDNRTRFHMIRRFQKAVSYARSLESLCNEEPTVCDLITKLESQAYAAFVEGMYLFEREQWSEASDKLKMSQAIYTRLMESVPDSADLVELYLQRVNELKPTLRYCAFNLNETGTNDFIEKFNADDIQDEFLANKFDALLIQERGKKSAQLTEVAWLGQSFAITKDVIRSFLLDIDQLLAEPEAKVTQIEKKLFASRDCLQVLKKSDQEKSVLYTYISYIRQRLICKRSLALIQAVRNDSEKVRLYETIIGALGEIEALPLEMQFENHAVEVQRLRRQIEAETLAFRAFRCYHIGCTGWLEWKKSIAVLHQCGQHAEMALNSGALEDDLIRRQLEELRLSAESGKFNLYGENAEENQDTEDTPRIDVGSRKRALLDRLDECVDRSQIERVPKLTQLPPAYEPVPCKPLFFDLALNHIVFPSLDDEMGLSEKATGTGAGLSGFVRGLFWKK